MIQVAGWHHPTYLRVMTADRAPDTCSGTSTGSRGRSTLLRTSSPPAARGSGDMWLNTVVETTTYINSRVLMSLSGSQWCLSKAKLSVFVFISNAAEDLKITCDGRAQTRLSPGKRDDDGLHECRLTSQTSNEKLSDGNKSLPSYKQEPTSCLSNRYPSEQCRFAPPARGRQRCIELST